MNDPKTTKDFGPIHDDYCFFQSHSTEAAQDRAQYLTELAAINRQQSEFTVLDFGCGDGEFSAPFLAQAAFPSKTLRLALVEPVGPNLVKAVDHLSSYTMHPIASWTELPDNYVNQEDLVLANHVLYYVPDLTATTQALVRALRAGGRWLTSMAGRENLLIQIWFACFDMIGEPLPFWVAANFATILDQQTVPYKKYLVRYRLAFEDTERHRRSILRFLLGDHFAKVPLRDALELFSAYTAQGKIDTEVWHHHFVVTGMSRENTGS